MVYRWRCRRCSFTVWAVSQQAVVRKAKQHLFDHVKHTVGTDDSSIIWECPHCGNDTFGYQRDTVVERIQSHLFTHYNGSLTADTHIAETVGESGNVLLQDSQQTSMVDNACLHLLTPRRISTQGVLLVTANPEPQLATWRSHLSTWPKALTIITPRSLPDDYLAPIPSDVNVHTLSGGIDLQQLGVMITRALQSLANSTQNVVVGFDILSEVLKKFELKPVFRFLTILTRQFAKAGAVTHFHLNPKQHSQMELNLVHSEFDLVVSTSGDVLVSDG